MKAYCQKRHWQPDKSMFQANHHCGQDSDLYLVQKALIRLRRAFYWEPEMGSRWLSEMGNNVRISSLNWDQGITEVPLGCWNGPVLGCKPITQTFHSRCCCASGPCCPVLSRSQVATFTAHADRQSSSPLGSAVIRVYDPKDLAIVLPVQRGMV